MSEAIDLVYDRLVADERLKAGTKYERLAAIAFRHVTGRETVHDLRLRGGTGVAHQIDAVVGDERKRILIEAKDYDRSVDLPLVRNFWAVVEDINPDEAFIITTQGFSENAVKYATAKGIQLAVLRPPREEDWESFIRRITLTITATGQTGPPRVTWHLHQDDFGKIEGDVHAHGLAETRDLELSNAKGERIRFLPLLDAQLKQDYVTVPLGGEGTIGRTNHVSAPTWLHAPGLPPLRVVAWSWTVEVASVTLEHVIGDGAAGLVAELLLRTVDGSQNRMITNQQIQSWTFDGKNVVPWTG